jgi:ABC-2 type transport system ATP-binding protein
VATALEIKDLAKTYDGGFQALKGVSLSIDRGEIFALLGPNGAGKTTLIGAVCGLVRPTAGTIRVDGFDVARQFREARLRVGLVPQELHVESYETVIATVRHSRALFGKAPNEDLIERVLKDLSLWDKKDNRIITLSGGMKRRVMIAKALAHEPSILFLDEPTAGVDVELRRDMWGLVKALSASGVTIILTTHYIEEAEELADRIGVINHGRLILSEDKTALMRKLGRKALVLTLASPLAELPAALAERGVVMGDEGRNLMLVFDSKAEEVRLAPLVGALMAEVEALGVEVSDFRTEESSLEDIFVDLLKEKSA